MTIGLASFHLVGYCCIFLVSILGVPAGGTGVAWSNVKSMRPAVVHIAVEPFLSIALGRSDTGWCFGCCIVITCCAGGVLHVCMCLGLRCHCSGELGNLLGECGKVNTWLGDLVSQVGGALRGGAGVH